MSCRVKAEKGTAASGFREWAVKLVGGSQWRWDCMGVAPCVMLERSRQGVSIASYDRRNKTVRPICYLRPGPRTGACVAVLCLVNLEPLTES